MTTPTDAELIEYLKALAKGNDHRHATVGLNSAADRLAALSAEKTKAVEAFADMCVKYHTLTLERDALGECFKELRDETLKLRAEHDRLRGGVQGSG